MAAVSLWQYWNGRVIFSPSAASYPQRRIKFHPRVGQGWTAVWRAAGHLVSSPGQRIPQIVHCSRALNCPGSWQKAIKDRPRADRILDQMLATSQKHRADFWGRKDILMQTAEKNLLRLSQLFLLPSGDPCGRNQFPAFPGEASDWTSSLWMQTLLAWSGRLGGLRSQSWSRFFCLNLSGRKRGRVKYSFWVFCFVINNLKSIS